jgi:hypothetical protein
MEMDGLNDDFFTPNRGSLMDYKELSNQVDRNLKWLRWIKYKQDKPLLHSDKLYRRLVSSLTNFYLTKKEKWNEKIREHNVDKVK